MVHTFLQRQMHLSILELSGFLSFLFIDNLCLYILYIYSVLVFHTFLLLPYFLVFQTSLFKISFSEHNVWASPGTVFINCFFLCVCTILFYFFISFIIFTYRWKLLYLCLSLPYVHMIIFFTVTDFLVGNILGLILSVLGNGVVCLQDLSFNDLGQV